MIQSVTHGVVLCPGREKSVKQRHPWIFSQAIQSLPDCKHGDVVAVYSSSSELLGHATLSRTSALRCRMISFGQMPYEEALRTSIKRAIKLRHNFFDEQYTNAYRLINAEGDSIPGLIVDKYGDALVIQIATAGMEKLKPWIVNELLQQIPCSWIYEKSTSPSRKEEKLTPYEGTLFGTAREKIAILENGLHFFAYPKDGQKTGFFLDQRNMRALVEQFAKGRTLLNTFSYTGAFSVYALRGGAKSVTSVDVSEIALKRCNEAMIANGFETKEHVEYAEDVFSFLKRAKFPYDFVILDPPAFAKKKQDIPQAVKGYKEINKSALERMPKGSLLLTCSCSYHMDEEHFRKVLFFAAKDAERDVRIISKHSIAVDHPLNLYHPEGDYLKSFLCYVD